jgi:glycosyltransferase involved in cell wall biosynthesis
LIEAMAWGLPVVTTSVGGAGEFLEHGHNSLLVTPGDVQGISHAISKLAGDRGLRQQMGRAARETISRFGIDHYVFTLSGIYEELANRLPRGLSARVSAPQQPRHEVRAPIVSTPDHANSAQG